MQICIIKNRQPLKVKEVGENEKGGGVSLKMNQFSY